MLHSSQLDISPYYFTKMLVEIDFENAPGDGVLEIKREHLDYGFNVVKDIDDGDEVILSLNVWSDHENHPTGLKLHFDVIGRFVANEELVKKIGDGTCAQEEVISTCLSILYGTIRDSVLTCSSKMPTGSIYLPTCTFPVEKVKSEES